MKEFTAWDEKNERKHLSWSQPTTWFPSTGAETKKAGDAQNSCFFDF